MGSQPPAARKRNAAQGASKDDSGNEFEGVVLGPRRPNSIKLAAIKKRMWYTIQVIQVDFNLL